MTKRADVIRFLGAKGASPSCPTCHENDWTVTDGSAELPHAFLMASPRGGGLVLPPPGFPIVALICNNCGFLRLHSERLIDEWVRQSSGPGKGEAPASAEEDAEDG